MIFTFGENQNKYCIKSDEVIFLLKTGIIKIQYIYLAIILVIHYTMKKPLATITIGLFLLLFFSCSKQETEKQLTSFPEIEHLILLADSAFVMENSNYADTIIQDALQKAEATRNADIILKTLFYNTSANISINSTVERLDKMGEFINKGLDYAKLFKRLDYIAYGNANLAEWYLAKGDLNQAVTAANLAFSTALGIQNDSCKIVCALQLARVYERQKNMLLAFRTYTNAHDIANKSGNEKHLAMVYLKLGGLYESLNKNEEAKDYYFRCLELDKKLNDIDGQIASNIALGDIYEYRMAKNYYETAEKLAVQFKRMRLLKIVQLHYFSYKIINGIPNDALRYYQQQPMIEEIYKNRGDKYVNWILAEIHLYGSQPDTAKFYFDKCTEAFQSDYDKNARLSLLMEYGLALTQLKKNAEATAVYREAFELSTQTSNSSYAINSAEELSRLYEQNSNYKEALLFAQHAENYKDSVQALSKERDFASLEIENENKRIENEKLKELEAEHHRHNIQYLAIIIAITFVFLLLMISGIMTISSRAIEILGFFSFIFLFEFIIMLLDHKIIALTHGEPLKIWLIKIALISLLMPFHHFIEEGLIHYLTSKKIIKVKERLNLKKLIPRKKAITVTNEDASAADNAVIDEH